MKVINVHGWAFLVNHAIALMPKFSYELMKRMRKKKSNNILVVGPAGIGKSYIATDLARTYEGLNKQGKDRFSVEQICFTYGGYMDLTSHLKYYKAIVFDEPAWVMDKHEWFKEVVRALSKTMSTTRFKLHPLLIPVINRALLEKTIRTYLIDWQVELRDRGKAAVYKISASQRQEKLYYNFFCNLRYHLVDSHLCRKDSCLVCPKLHMNCLVFRAKYERFKARVQSERYNEELEKATAKELPQTTSGRLTWIQDNFKDLLDPYKKDLSPRMVWVKLKVSRSTAYDLVKAYKEIYPEYWLNVQEEKRVTAQSEDKAAGLDQEIDDLLSKA